MQNNKKILESSKAPFLENCRDKKRLPSKKQLPYFKHHLQRQRNNRKWHNRKELHWLTEGTFKQRYTQRKLSFRNINYSNSSTELSKRIRTLKDKNTDFTINWSILATAPACSNKSKQCHLCLTEKLYLIRAKKRSLLNNGKELVSKCRHENKFYLANFTNRHKSSIESIFHAKNKKSH